MPSSIIDNIERNTVKIDDASVYKEIINKSNFNYKDKSRQPFERYLNKKDPAYVPMWDDYVKQADDFTRKLIESLKQGLQPPPAKKDDQW